ncbi:hypothetical protein GIB67_019316, partial [Kingdonia uniflora]
MRGKAKPKRKTTPAPTVVEDVVEVEDEIDNDKERYTNSKNWLPDEFVNLACAWSQVSQYLATMNNQKATIFWLNIEAEVRGNVDGAFDLGYLVTANSNGQLLVGMIGDALKIFEELELCDDLIQCYCFSLLDDDEDDDENDKSDGSDMIRSSKISSEVRGISPPKIYPEVGDTTLKVGLRWPHQLFHLAVMRLVGVLEGEGWNPPRHLILYLAAV